MDNMDYQDNHNDSDWEFEDGDENDELFTKATQQVQRTHDKLLPNDLLELYGLYKQATVGPCNTSKPGMFSMQARAKWCAWHDLADMPSDKAKELYIEKMKQLDPKWFENVQNGVKSMAGGTGWVVHSIELPPDDLNAKEEHEKDVFDFVKDHNLQRLKQTVKTSDFELLDEHGMGLIHWATDANDLEILEFLLSSGCPVDFRDAEQQSALHYAASCDHLECVQLLLRFGANKMAQDAEGQTCVDVSNDPSIRSLLES
ncbi:acyl-CoA-binding domain-containing protein 6 [Lucilia sericata]|uniref:acyl-CoA-binding domain-containing protein 6 n=1 Tax=Lucilia sericata TaxID=13632 RepID=UPI0018A84C02|nr:acyl-CoA-binding domain-containing protein 6 [Lucilia sericata]